MAQQSLSENQITEMAECALSTYEMTDDKISAMRAAQEHAIDEFGIKPKKSAVLLAYKIALMGWGEIVQRTKQEINA
jgi:hypothetical protein